MIGVLIRRGRDTRAVRTEERPWEAIEGNYLQAKERGLRRNWTC